MRWWGQSREAQTQGEGEPVKECVCSRVCVCVACSCACVCERMCVHTCLLFHVLQGEKVRKEILTMSVSPVRAPGRRLKSEGHLPFCLNSCDFNSFDSICDLARVFRA